MSAKPRLSQRQVLYHCGCWFYCGWIRGRVGVGAAKRGRAGSRVRVGTSRAGAVQCDCSSGLDGCTTVQGYMHMLGATVIGRLS